MSLLTRNSNPSQQTGLHAGVHTLVKFNYVVTTK